MRVVAGVATLFLLGGVFGVAQYTPPRTTSIPDGASTVCLTELRPDKDKNHGKGDVVTVCKTVLVQGCPIDMHVRHGIGGGMIAADENGVKRQVFAPRLRLFLNEIRPAKSGQKIVSATVTVHGSNGKPRMQNLDVHGAEDGDLNSGSVERTLSVDLANWGDPGVSGDFRLPGFTSTSRVDLESVTYEDGSTWKLAAPGACHVAPDPLMFISH